MLGNMPWSFRTQTLSSLLLLSLLAPLACRGIDPDIQNKDGTTIRTEFSGNKSISTDSLLRITRELLKEFAKDPSRDTAVFDAALEIEDFYHSEGFPDVIVKHQIQKGTPTRVHFTIKEGPSVSIQRLEIIGNRNLTRDQLFAMLPARKSGAFGTGDLLFVRDDLEAFAEAIRSRYQGEGYMEVQVKGPLIERKKGANKANIRFEIQEGPLFTIHQVLIAPKLRKALGEKRPGAPIGKPLSAKLTNTYINKLISILRNKGFPRPRIRPQVRKAPGKYETDILIDGDPGIHGKIGEILIEGNARTKSAFIERTFGLTKGNLFQGELEQQGLRDLYLTGLFKKISVRYEDMGKELLRIHLKVQEGESREISALVGYGSYEGPRVGAQYQDHNLFGIGMDLLLSGKVSFKSYRLSTKLSDRDFLASDGTLDLGADFSRREEPSFTDKSLRFTASYKHKIIGPLEGQAGYAFSRHFDTSTPIIEPIDFLRGFNEGRVFGELSLDSRDHPLRPFRGHREFFIVERASDSLGGDVDFTRLRMRATFYQPISPRLRLIANADLGLLWPDDGSASIPLQERFFNGGHQSVRSFRESKLGPRDSNGNRVGGEYRNTFNLELRTPLAKSLEAAFFFDAGNLGRNIQDYSLRDLHFGIGIGLRIHLPALPIRLDFGVNPNLDPGDENWVLHFSLGEPF
jgi:outer membrane protein assembly complex protein YaeT